MKIALVSGSHPPMKCGVGEYTARLARSLERLGNSASVVTSREIGMEEFYQGQRLLPVVENWGGKGSRDLLRALFGLAPDVVNIQYPTQPYGRQVMINLVPWVVRSRLKVPVVYTVHEYGSFTWSGRLRIALSVALSASAIIPDRVNLDLMESNLPLLKKKLHWVPVGANIEPALENGYERELWRARCGAGKDTIVLSFFGFLSPSKGVETLLEALAVLRASSPDLDWRLLLIADSQPAHPRYASYHAKIERMLRESPVRQRVYWTGFSTPGEASQYLLASDICIMPFADGASPRRTTLLTALAHGLPVVSTRPKGRLDPQLVDGEGILLVAPFDARELARCLAELASDPGARLRLAQGALQVARSFSWDAIARGAVEVYQAAQGLASRP